MGGGHDPLSPTDRTAEPPKERFLEPVDELVAPRVPSPFILPELAHPYIDGHASWTLGLARPRAATESAPVGLVRVGFEAHEVLKRRFYFGVTFPVAVGRAAPGARELGAARPEADALAGNLEASVRLVFPMPSWLALGGTLGIVAPTAAFARHGPAQAVARAAVSTEPTEIVQFLPGRMVYRPAADLRILRGPFVFQVRQGLDLLHDTSRGGITAHGRILIHAGFLTSAKKDVEVSLEGQQLYLFGSDPSAVSDLRRSFFVVGPAARFAFHAADVGASLITTVFDPLSPELDQVLALRVSVVFHQ